MAPVQRQEIPDYVTYGEQRDSRLSQIMEIRKPRRIVLGSELIFLFQNTDTIRHQILESIYKQKLVKESDIENEINFYNKLLGNDGELSCSLITNVPQESDRHEALIQWQEMIKSIYLLAVSGEKLRPLFLPPSNEHRPSCLCYAKFVVGTRPPTALGIDHETLSLETAFTRSQRQAIIEDLNSNQGG